MSFSWHAGEHEMIGRRGLLAASLGNLTGPVMASPLDIGVSTFVPADHAVPAARLAWLAAALRDAGGPAVRPGSAAQHGSLFREPLFEEAPLFAGLPFGMAAAELRNWLNAGGRQVWDAGWARAGFRAFPCAMLECRCWHGAVLPFAFGQVVELAVRRDHWAALPHAARVAIQVACSRGMATIGHAEAPGQALAPSAGAALAAETAARLRREVPEAARQAYAAARRAMLG
jgi:hypothetical protein